MRLTARTDVRPALVVGLFAFVLYLWTAAPGLTWRNGGIDSGELATAVATRSVAHPPGYPTYLLVGRVATLLPVEPARALAWLSALCAALTCGAVVFAGSRHVTSNRNDSLVAAAPGLWLATAPLLWASGTYAEVNAPMAAATALWLALRGWAARPAMQLLWLGAALGLTLGIHALLALLIAATALGQIGATRTWRDTIAAVAALGAGALTGAAIAFGSLAVEPLFLPAGPVNWYAPQTWDGWRLLVTADAYRGLLSAAGAPLGMLVMLRTLVENLAFAGAVAVVAGLQEVLARRDERYSDGTLLCAGLALIYAIFAASYAARDAEAYLLPALVLLTPAAVAGLRSAAAALARTGSSARVFTATAVLAGIAVVPTAVNGALNFHRLDLSADREASEYAAGLLIGAPPGAVLVAKGDAATFALWYARYALGTRADVAVINDDLLPRDWYRDYVTRVHGDLSGRPRISVPSAALSETSR